MPNTLGTGGWAESEQRSMVTRNWQSCRSLSFAEVWHADSRIRQSRLIKVTAGALLVACLTAVTASGGISIASTGPLYGRVEDFVAPEGPQFPGFAESVEQVSLKGEVSKWPLELSGDWHGILRVDRCDVLPACDKFDSGIADSFRTYPVGGEGPCNMSFKRAGKGSVFQGGISLFRVPLISAKGGYQKVLNALCQPTAQQIALLNHALEPLSSPIVSDYGSRCATLKERLLGDATTSCNSESYKWSQPAENVFEEDSVNKRTVNSRDSGQLKTFYIESVYSFTIQDKDTIVAHVASARYNADRQLLLYLFESGTLTRGKTKLCPLRELRATMTPVHNGVQMDVDDGMGGTANVFLPDATLNRSTLRSAI